MATDFLHGVEIVEIDDGPRPIRTVRSAVIGLLGTAPTGPVNTPVLIAGNRIEAAAIFGSAATDAGFTIPAALDGIFDQTGAVVVVINVADPDNPAHVETVAPGTRQFDDAGGIPLGAGVISVTVDGPVTAPARFAGSPGTIAIPAGATVEAIAPADGGAPYADTGYTVAGGVITRKATGSIPAGAAVRVTYTIALAEGTDWILDRATGRLVRVAGGAILPGASLSVGVRRLDPAAVGLGDVIGGADAAGWRGVHALVAAESVVKVSPRILIAPGFTHQRTDGANPVVAELVGIAERLKAVIIADGPDIDDAAAIDYREDWGSARVYVVDPWVKIYDTRTETTIREPPSARVAGLIAKSDAERGFWWSPSNMVINGIVGTSRPVDFALGDTSSRANLLNEREVATIIHREGYRLWGNRSCSSDPKWAFLQARRTADMINQSILEAHIWAVDRNITRTYVDDVVEGVNAYLRHLTSIGAILGGRCWADPAANPADQVAQGKVCFDFDFTPPYPAERISFRSRLVDDYIDEIFVRPVAAA